MSDDLVFVEDCEALAKDADWPDMLRLIAMVRERDTKLLAFRVRLAKHEKAAEELRDARAAVLASNHPGFDGSSDRFYEALEAIEAILREDVVE
jgi:hypothetical protein